MLSSFSIIFKLRRINCCLNFIRFLKIIVKIFIVMACQLLLIRNISLMELFINRSFVKNKFYTLTWGLVYWPCFFVCFPYWIENFGHLCRQPRQATHFSFTQTGLSFSNFIAAIGHFFWHRPHPMQLSSTWKLDVFLVQEL